MMVPGLSGILIIGKGTREIFTGGDRSHRGNYETLAVPELKIITPLETANTFGQELKQALRNIKSGDFDRSLDFVDIVIDSPPDYDTANKY